MRRLVPLLLLLLALTPAVGGQGKKPLGDKSTLEIKGGNVAVVPIEKWVKTTQDVQVTNSFPFWITAPQNPKALYFWTYPPLVTAVEESLGVLKVTGGPKGETTISVKVVAPNLDEKGVFLGWDTKFGSVVFYIGEVAPGPVPPDPKPPDPKPPDPKPPDPKPITGDLRVLMVRESAQGLTRGQGNVWNSTVLKSFFDAKCVKSTTTNVPEWRKIDQNVVITKEPPTMDKFMKDSLAAIKGPPATPLPVLVIAVGQSGKLHALPETEQEVIDLVNQATGGK